MYTVLRLLMIDKHQICPKCVEFFTKINLKNSASRWLLLYEYIMLYGPLNVKFVEYCCLLVRDTVQFGSYQRFVGKIWFWLQGTRISGFRLTFISWRRQQSVLSKGFYLPKYTVSSLRRLKLSQSSPSEPRTSHDLRHVVYSYHIFILEYFY
jgi:hypothetical protein